MKYGILGTGTVACRIAEKLLELGHEVMLGSRSANKEDVTAWCKEHGAQYGTFTEAAAFGERVFCSVQGIHALDALTAAIADNLKGKILIDQTNPYHYADGHISLDPRYSGSTCLGEEVQKLLPETKVVKTLNFICNHLMTNPSLLSEPVTGFYCGNDNEAKSSVNDLLHEFGWTETLDLGGIDMSRYTEMLGAVWPAMLNATGNMDWGLKLVTK